jgi:hypothetical protein
VGIWAGSVATAGTIPAQLGEGPPDRVDASP